MGHNWDLDCCKVCVLLYFSSRNPDYNVVQYSSPPQVVSSCVSPVTHLRSRDCHMLESPKLPFFSKSKKAPWWTAYVVVCSFQAIFDAVEHRQHAPEWYIPRLLDLMGHHSSLALLGLEARVWIVLYKVSCNLKQRGGRINYTVSHRCNFRVCC